MQLGPLTFPFLASLLSLPVTAQTLQTESIRPLVLWHGLGDSHSSPGMLEFIDLVKQVHPGLFVHSVYVEEDLKADQRATWLGDVSQQLERVADQLHSIPELSRGFDAIGFSQGGQFLRAFNELFNYPPINNLITFGSQHMGISHLPGCKQGDLFCNIARSAARSGVYTDWAQSHIVQAQYFRDHRDLQTYLTSNKFLVGLNNELAKEQQNATYKENFISLTNLVLVLFSQDQTVVPKESSWFGSYAPSDGESMDEPIVIPMRLQPIYLNDSIGLRTLDESGRVHLEVCDGLHMQIARECWEPLVRKYVGGKVRTLEETTFRVQDW